MKRYHELIEGRILSRSDAIIVNNEQTRKLFLQKYDVENKIFVLPHAYDPEDFPAQDNTRTKRTKNDKFTVTYTGSFYGLRSPEPFLKALRFLIDEKKEMEQKIRVKFIGSLGEYKNLISAYKLEKVVELTGVVYESEVSKEVAIADILLLIDAPDQEQSVFLPGKVAEYIRSGKPILGITPLAGASADTIESTKTGVVVLPEDGEGIKRNLMRYYDLWSNSNLRINPNWNEIEKYSAKNYAKKFSGILDTITDHNSQKRVI